MGWWSGSSGRETCLASVKPGVQTLVPPKKEKENITRLSQ
jgi:hypothetical protein